MLRSSDEIRIQILKKLSKKGSSSFNQLAVQLKTGYSTIVKNCQALQRFKFVMIEKVSKENSPFKKEYFKVSATKEGLTFLEKIN